MKSVVAGLVLAGSLLGFGSAQAALPEALSADFAPVDGLVLLARDGEVLVDAAAEQGVRVGELFSVLTPGEPIRHPVSGAMIGRLDTVSGVLAITQVREGFASARQIAGPLPATGAAIRRFDRVKAWFVDPAGSGEALFAEVRAALPQLDWQPYSVAAGADAKVGLQFILRGNTLEARGAGELLHSYTLSAPAPAATPVAVVPVAPPVPVKGVPVAATAAQGAPVVVPQAAQAVDNQPSKWLGAAAKGVPVALAVADFDGDGHQELARLFVDRLEVGRIRAGRYESLQVADLVKGREGLSLVAFDLNANGRPELFVSAASGDEVRSTIYEFDGKKYRELADDQRWFINLVALADGPALLGQQRQPGLNPFAGSIHRLQWQGGELMAAAEVRLPAGATVYSIAAYPAAGPDRFVRINDAGHLSLGSFDVAEQWVSDLGGDSEIGFKQAESLLGGGGEDLSRDIYLPLPLSVAADGLLLTAFNSGFTAAAMFRQMTSAQIIGWRWEGYELMPKWRIADIEGYVPAVTIADADNDGVDELVMLLAYPNSNPFASRRSVIRLLALN